MSEMVKVKQEAWDFFLYSYFRIVPGEGIESQKLKCAYRAYLDFCRTIHSFEESLKADNQTNRRLKNAFVSEICKFIVKKIDEVLLSFDDGEEKDITKIRNQFDNKHHKICLEIIQYASDIQFAVDNKNISFYLKKPLTYGQAQKWLNMTIKYMWMLNLVDEECSKNEAFTQCFHVAVDRYILNTDLVKNDSDIDKSESWSKWTTCIDDYRKSNYYNLQYSLRKNEESPFLWETSAWIEIASKESKGLAYDFIDNIIVNLK